MTDPDALPALPLIDRQLRMLGELAEIGLEQARALDRQVRRTDPEPSLDELQAAALAYARVSRAVRLTLVLQSKIVEAAEGAQAAAAGDADEDAPSLPLDARKARVERVIERLAKAEHPRDEEEVDALVGEAAERLDDEDLYGDLLDRPMSEIVARLCKDLGLSPDWTELAEELWAKEEIASGGPGWPLAGRAMSGRAVSVAALDPLRIGDEWGDEGLRDTS